MDEIIVIGLCLIVNAFLSAFEMAFVSMPKVQLKRLARDGNKLAQRLIPLRESPERTLSVIQIGITLVGAVSAAVGGAGAAESIEPFLISKFGLAAATSEFVAILIVVLPLTYLSVVIGELVPKTLAIRNPSSIVLGGARFLFVADKFLGPAITFLEKPTQLFIKYLFPSSIGSQNPVEESALEMSHLTSQHRKYLLNMAGIERKLVKDLFVPWDQVAHVDMNDSVETVTSIIFKGGHTRLPVTQMGIVVGIIHAKEVLAAKDSGITDWLTVMRPALKVKSTDGALAVLKMLQDKRNHMAIVDDCKGIITLEDITAEIFGDIYDEYEDGRVQKLIASRTRSRHPPKF